MALTNRQATLIQLLNQLSTQNLANRLNSDGISLDLPGLDVDVDVDIDLDGDGGTDTPTPPSPTTPSTMDELLMDLVNEQVAVTTPFGTVTGTLLLVRSDYVVILEDTGAQVLVRTEKIEFVSEL